MRRKKASLIIVLSLVLTTVISASATLKLASCQGDGRKLPDGDWKLSFEPYRGPGYGTAPVQVVAVKGEIMPDGRIRIRWPHLRRNSVKSFKTVTLTAYVYDESRLDTVLLRGPIIGLGFNPGNWPSQNTDLKESIDEKDARARVFDRLTEIAYRPLLSSLVKDGKLEGHYRIAIGVSKVIFDDGTVWEQQAEPLRAEPNK